MTEITVNKHGDSVTITVKSDEVFKNTTIILSAAEASDLALKLMCSTVGHLAASD